MPTWLHFGFIFRVLGPLGGLLGASWRRLGALLGASWRILARLGASWSVLEPSWRRFGPQKKPVLIGTGSAFVCCKRPVPSCRVWCLVLLRKKAKLDTLPKQPKHTPLVPFGLDFGGSGLDF